MPQEISLFLPFTPKLDGVAQRVHGLGMSPDEGAAEVDVLEVVFFGLEVGNLADVVGDGVEEGAGHVFYAEAVELFGVGEGGGGVAVAGRGGCCG